eukprot:NODE_157_length_15108_cov_0.423079.p4 type:complete len:320 gc:universal NODE_157_length_15108_cov_0.423079:9292-10251(+)
MEFAFNPGFLESKIKLEGRERIILQADNVGLYNQEERLYDHDKGTICLSNFCIYWQNEVKCIAFYLEQITHVDYSPNLFLRHAKIKIYFGDRFLQLSFRGAKEDGVIMFGELKIALNKREWALLGGLQFILITKKATFDNAKDLMNDALSGIDLLQEKADKLLELFKDRPHFFDTSQRTDNLDSKIQILIKKSLKSSQIVPLIDLYYAINRSDQYNMTSPKEFLESILFLQSKNELVFRRLEGSGMVQSIDFTDDMFSATVISLLEKHESVDAHLVATIINLDLASTFQMMDYICASYQKIVKDENIENCRFFLNSEFI